MNDPRAALEALRRADLAALCERFGVELLVAFGSTVRGAEHPNDLDLAVAFRESDPDFLGFLDAVSDIAVDAEIDLMPLDRAGPVARERALVGTRVLYERTSGELARRQLRAMQERMDTDWLRRLDLELMAS